VLGLLLAGMFGEVVADRILALADESEAVIEVGAAVAAVLLLSVAL